MNSWAKWWRLADVFPVSRWEVESRAKDTSVVATVTAVARDRDTFVRRWISLELMSTGVSPTSWYCQNQTSGNWTPESQIKLGLYTTPWGMQCIPLWWMMCLDGLC